ncbi:MAG: hypothetical protein IPP50_15065 [Piscinibacter sp.]|nr:hypothetical protein [Piscinibacter sp.]
MRRTLSALRFAVELFEARHHRPRNRAGKPNRLEHRPAHGCRVPRLPAAASIATAPATTLSWKFSTLGVYGDYFLGSSFRFTAGALIGQRKASGNGVATNGTITINGTTYPAAGESVDAEARFWSFAPYLGIGFGHAQVSKA